MQPAASFGFEANIAMVPSKYSVVYVCALHYPCMAGLMLAFSGIASSAWPSLFLDQCCDAVLTDSQSTRCTRALSVISTFACCFVTALLLAGGSDRAVPLVSYVCLTAHLM